MKNMDPKAMASMSKMMGREIDPKQMEQMQSMMSDMSAEDMQKWSKRAQKVAGAAQYPLAAYRRVQGWCGLVGAGGFAAIFAGLLALMWAGHATEAF